MNKTVIDYTLEQFLAEQKHNEQVIQALDKIASVMEKFEKFGILIDHRVNKIEKKLKGKKNGL